MHMLITCKKSRLWLGFVSLVAFSLYRNLRVTLLLFQSTSDPQKLDAERLYIGLPRNSLPAAHHGRDTNHTVLADQRPRIAIFYNVFTANSTLTLEIINQQLQQLAAHKNNVLNGAQLFYTTAGKYLNLSCPPLFHCTRLSHDENGSEVNTLQFLYRYCQEHDNDEVIYMHTKGSFNPHKKGQEKLRRALTEALYKCAATAVMSRSNVSHKCDVCSLRFSPLPHWHGSGNHWWASCKHVNQLKAPDHFEDNVRRVIEDTPDYLNAKRAMPAHVGSGRFAYEHWIHTHPQVRPCDVLTNSTFTWKYPKGQNQLENVQFAAAMPAPDLRLHREYWQGFIKGFPEYPALSPFSNLTYRLVEGCLLYDMLPPRDSWVWDFYQTKYTVLKHSSCSAHLQQIGWKKPWRFHNYLAKWFNNPMRGSWW